jgi:hypothetical protein
MSSHNNEVKVNFTGTAILSFAIIFSLILLMSTCHGPYKTGEEKTATARSAD